MKIVIKIEANNKNKTFLKFKGFLIDQLVFGPYAIKNSKGIRKGAKTIL